MSRKTKPSTRPEAPPVPAVSPAAVSQKRVVFTMGGKGGIGKTGILCLLADWYSSHGRRVRLIDFDIENREAAGFQHFFPEAVKIDLHKKEALDEMIGITDDPEADILLADQPAAAGARTFEWFRDMHEAVSEEGIAMTAIGVVTGDPGSTAGVLRWAGELGNRVNYLIFLNEHEQPGESFHYWHNSEEASRFVEAVKPAVVRLESRNPDLENALRNRGLTFRRVAEGGPGLPPEIAATKYKLRARGYVSRFNAAVEEHTAILLP